MDEAKQRKAPASGGVKRMSSSSLGDLLVVAVDRIRVCGLQSGRTSWRSEERPARSRRSADARSGWIGWCRVSARPFKMQSAKSRLLTLQSFLRRPPDPRVHDGDAKSHYVPTASFTAPCPLLGMRSVGDHPRAVDFLEHHVGHRRPSGHVDLRQIESD
jgi:hypothetical protein